MSVILQGAQRCDRCERVTYKCRRLELGVLCPRCYFELRDTIQAWLHGAEITAHV